MQCHAIQCNKCNTIQYNAIPFIINNCWRSVPLPSGQYMAIFVIVVVFVAFVVYVGIVATSLGSARAPRKEHFKQLKFSNQPFLSTCSILFFPSREKRLLVKPAKQVTPATFPLEQPWLFLKKLVCRRYTCCSCFENCPSFIHSQQLAITQPNPIHLLEVTCRNNPPSSPRCRCNSCRSAWTDRRQTQVRTQSPTQGSQWHTLTS